MPDHYSNPFILIIELMFLALIFFVGALVLMYFINLIPFNPLTNTTKLIYLDVFGFFDKSFSFLTIFLLFLVIVNSYFNPSIFKGIINILFILVYGFVFITIKTSFITILNLLQFSTIMPNTYAFLNDNWLAPVIFFILVISAILSFRKEED